MPASFIPWHPSCVFFWWLLPNPKQNNKAIPTCPALLRHLPLQEAFPAQPHGLEQQHPTLKPTLFPRSWTRSSPRNTPLTATFAWQTAPLHYPPLPREAPFIPWASCGVICYLRLLLTPSLLCAPSKASLRYVGPTLTSTHASSFHNLFKICLKFQASKMQRDSPSTPVMTILYGHGPVQLQGPGVRRQKGASLQERHCPYPSCNTHPAWSSVMTWKWIE